MSAQRRGRRARAASSAAAARQAPAPAQTPSSRCRPPRRPSHRAAASGAGRRGDRRPQPASHSRRGYDPSAAEPRDSEYHYGSDFGDESDEESEPSERVSSSDEESEPEPEPSSDSDFSLGPGSPIERRARPPSPEPPWLREGAEPPSLEPPPSSDDLPLERQLTARAAAVYETLRRFRHAVRLSPFRVEDLCSAVACDEQSALLAEVHAALLRSLLREEDAQQTHFGPADHKDSVNVALYLLDAATWPEALRLYVDSDPSFDRDALAALETREYPFAGPEERIKVLEFLCDRFLATNPVRDDLTSEVSILYDDHCRSCHRLGDLLCCETCPAVYHLECVDPPLLNVPTEDWQCSLCKLHKLSGVTDCVSDLEKRGLLCRHEHLGYDRHGRKYWFICRRIFVEAEDGTVWYYSSVLQFEELLSILDSKVLENVLYKELSEHKAEICRQMEITEKITEQCKAGRKSYLEVENSIILKKRQERSDKKPQDFCDSLTNESNVEMAENDANQTVESQIDESEIKEESIVKDEENSKKIEDRVLDKQLESMDTQRLTRLKMNQITSGTLLFKLGNEGGFKTYVNQYTVNPMALNKPQRNEERDKKRHLANKFSLTCAQEFKWIGNSTATRSQLVNSLRQTILHLENSIAPVFMHPNWPLLRKPWLQAVHISNVPRDFARALVVLQACIKNVVFVQVWHEQLGHVRFQRITAAEREERKKLDKREKKEKEEEEEKNKVSFFVKYPIPSKHQIWKQKGEEYRIHAQWGWLWHSATRKFRNIPNYRPGLSAGPQKYAVQVNLNDSNKIIQVEPKTYEFLCNKHRNSDISDQVPQDVKDLKLIQQPRMFSEIDIEKVLSSSARIFYPKIAKKSRLDDLLARRVHLKLLEERRFDQNVFLQKDESTVKEEEEQNVDVENDECETENGLLPKNTEKEDMAIMTKEIQTLRQRYAEAMQLARGYKCYNRDCNASAATLSQGLVFTANCYSPLCVRKANLRKELLLLLNKVRNSNMNVFNNTKDPLKSLLHQQLTVKIEKDPTEYTNSIIKDLISAVASAQKYDEKCINSFVRIHESVNVELDIKPKIEPFDDDRPENVLDETVIPAVGNEMELDQGFSTEDNIDVETDKVIDNSESERKCKKERKYRDVSIVKSEEYDGDRPPIPKLRISTRSRPKGNSSDTEVTTKVPYKPTYMAPFNRRVYSSRNIIKREGKSVKELGPDGSPKVYSATLAAGKVYLKKIIPLDKNKKKRIPVKYPLCSTFHTKSKAKSIMVLPAHELRKLGRHAGRFQVMGFNHNSKPNPCVWPYPCSRPLFKTCWLYRTINLSSLAAVALQIRILWTCIRWDDMATKPSNSDGKNQITTETEIITSEMLKHRHIGQFLDKTQYLRRKVVIPLEVPKTVREVTSIRSGLRKRKRAESPQSTEPQVTEEWVDEDKLELWEIRQYGERVERAVPVTRTTTGKLPPSRITQESRENSPVNSVTKISAQEIKEKMEQQLRMQRAAHQQKRALELSQGVSTPVSNKAVIGTKRVFMTKSADGTTKLVTQPPLTPIQSATAQSAAKTTPVQASRDGPQKVQIIRGPDGKITVRGLIAGQQLIQMPDGKLHVIASGQQGNIPSGGTVIATGSTVPTPKITVTSAIRPHTKITQSVSSTSVKTSTVVSSPTTSLQTTSLNKVIIKQQSTLKPIITSDKQVQLTPNQRIITQTSGQQIIMQGNQQLLVQSPQQMIIQGQPKLNNTPMVQVSQGTVLQNSRPIQTVVVQGNSTQLVQGQLIQGGQLIQNQQIVRPVQIQQQLIPAVQSPQPVNRMVAPTQHIVVSNPLLAQQMAAGKLQLASIHGQQVLVRPVGNNQVVIVAQVTPSTQLAANAQSQESNPQNQVVQNINTQVSNLQGVVAPQQNQISPLKQGSPIQAPPPPSATQPTTPLTEDQLTEQRLLAGQPPGTVIRTVTAQVVNLEGGARIVLQGLQGNTLTQQQLQLVQAQVKAQLLKAQEQTGKQGVLGPTKIYLAVQPNTATVNQNSIVTPSPLATGVRAIQQQMSQNNLNKAKTPTVNGQDSNETNSNSLLDPDATPTSSSNKFVLTPDYIQQTIKNALKQENLNPEIEEKLLQLQKYQERQMKPETNNGPSHEISREARDVRTLSNSSSGLGLSSSRRRPTSGRNTDDEEWVESTPRKRNRPSTAHHESDVSLFRNETIDESQRTPSIVNRPSRPMRVVIQQPQIQNTTTVHTQSPYVNQPPSPVDERRRAAHHSSKLPLLLFRQKELLKKDIIKKRSLLEKELGIEIQKELSAELAMRTKAERNKQEEVRVANTPTIGIIGGGGNNSRQRSRHQSGGSNRQLVPNPNTPSSNKSKSRKKEKLLCVCQTPYDETKFYVGCEHCNNWFHGDCVGISEESSKTLNEFVCAECKHARDTQVLYCLCRQPYDNSQFYICCDRCQDWFHGRCVGILQSEADNIDEYICPNCQKNNSVNFANMKELSTKDFENLRKLIKQIQMHKSAWPFMDPVDPKEAPMYYKVIKEPMDLKVIEKKINEESYNMLSEFIGDMTKIFDNCRYFNPKDSQFYRCAENLEAFFVQKIKFFREKLFEANQ